MLVAKLAKPPLHCAVWDGVSRQGAAAGARLHRHMCAHAPWPVGSLHAGCECVVGTRARRGPQTSSFIPPYSIGRKELLISVPV